MAPATRILIRGAVLLCMVGACRAGAPTIEEASTAPLSAEARQDVYTPTSDPGSGPQVTWSEVTEATDQAWYARAEWTKTDRVDWESLVRAGYLAVGVDVSALSVHVEMPTDPDVPPIPLTPRTPLQPRWPVDLDPTFLPTDPEVGPIPPSAWADPDGVRLLPDHQALLSAYSTELADLLDQRRDLIVAAESATGRLKGYEPADPDAWLGTAWVVQSAMPEEGTAGVLATARHVVKDVVELDGSRWRLTRDLRFDVASTAHPWSEGVEFDVTGVLWVEADGDIDLALLEVAPATADGVPLPPAIPLHDPTPSATVSGLQPFSREPPWVVVIGYPGDDLSGCPEEHRWFIRGAYADRFDERHRAPGKVESVNQPSRWEPYLPTALTHSAWTLPGNSGSVVLDLRSCEAVGVHQGGTFCWQHNTATAAWLIAWRLQQLGRPIHGGPTWTCTESPPSSPVSPP